MSHSVCPWWIGYLLASPVRGLVHSADQILSPFVHAGMTVLEPGPGMGFFTLPLARAVGPTGRVVAVDIQPKMIAALKRRADKAGLLARIDARLARPESMGVDDLSAKVDFALAFAMVHELPSVDVFFQEVAKTLRPDGRLLLVEPAGHVKPDAFDGELASAAKTGLRAISRPTVRRSHAALLVKA
jgi:ubiquinone/menaquinone biosynthesis C-methylase UbiE